MGPRRFQEGDQHELGVRRQKVDYGLRGGRQENGDGRKLGSRRGGECDLRIFYETEKGFQTYEEKGKRGEGGKDK